MKSKTVTELAPAKVNLTLSVGHKRPDGYHDLLTLMETVSLCDILTVKPEESFLPEIKLSICGKYRVPEDRTNLVVRAAEAYFGASDERFSVSVSLEKNIPTEAGLGGGSADAAAMLRALNRIVDRPLPTNELSELAASLGADVAFCLFGGTAVCTGIGERIEQVSDPARRFYTVVMGKERVSTPNAYRALDQNREEIGKIPSIPQKNDLIALARGEKRPLANDFETVVFPEHPGIAERKARLLSLGATDALMSGSGAAVFGVFPDENSAKQAADAFDDEDAFAVSTVAQYYC